MFSNKNSKIEAEDLAASNNIFGKGTFIKGEIESVANVRLEGRLVGNISTKAKLVLSETAKIEGNIYAQNAEIAGTVTGHILVTNLLILKPTAYIKGDLTVGKLGIEVGAMVNGTCKMADDIASVQLKNVFLGDGEKNT
jgi:cytoskeletal protein CcmA (bactofilin family)